MAPRLLAAGDGLAGLFGGRAQRGYRRLVHGALGYRYAAASRGPRDRGWITHDQNPNRLIGQAGRLVRARVRQLVRDFPLFARAVEARVNLIVGNGGSFQARVTKADGSPDENLNGRIEDLWAETAESLDTTGRLDAVEMARLAMRQETEAGEALGVLVRPSNPAGPVPFAVALYEPEWLTDLAALPGKDREIINGVEVEKASGRVLAYWLANPEAMGNPARVEAADVVHLYDMLRPGQLRGVSPLVSAVQVARDLGEYINSEVEGANMASRWLAKAKTNRPAEEWHKDRVTDNASRTEGETNDTRVQELGYNIIEVLRPNDGEDFDLLSSNRPSKQFAPFVDFVTRLIAAVAGLSPELISGNYKGISYSNLRGVRLDLAANARPHQRRFGRQFWAPIHRAWLDAAVLAGKLTIPGYWQRRNFYHRALIWLPPGIENADVLRESKALIDKMAAGLMDPLEYLGSQGKDPREVLKGLAQFQAMAKQEGAEIAWPKTPVKQNPAAMGA